MGVQPRRVDADRLRELARFARSPGGRTQGETVPEVYEFLATVSATHTGPNRVDLDRHGTTIAGVAYLASYTPTVSDVVLARFVGSDCYVLGKFA